MNAKVAKKASQEDWHPADVICALRKKKTTLRALATLHGIKDSSSFSAALVRSLPTNEKRIADALGIHPMVIWPSRYNEDGTRKLQGFRAVQCSAAAQPVNGYLGLAA
ncbi:helix-turn-helix domain-containing protein [Propionivibrio sp.]|uniref:helix-turn-helix domain-containing protein n=1 Tax=Propionivibrio sp. TaxID=2212460 RepID=UPI003BF42B03